MLQYMWDKTDIALGTVKVGSVNEMKFTLLGEGTVDHKLIAIPCGCTVATWNGTENSLSVTYTARPVPINFISQGKTSYNVVMPIEVPVKIGEVLQRFNLTFTATVQ